MTFDLELESSTSETQNGHIEILLVGVPSDVIGSNNSFTVAPFNRHHITVWIRKRYLFINGTVYAVLPRKLDSFPDKALSQFSKLYEDNGTQFATHIDKSDSAISIFYSTKEEYIQLIWDVEYDEWSMRTSTESSGTRIKGI